MMLTNSYEDFVMTSIKCPPPKIVAVKRSLKQPTKNQNIMDDDELSSKEDYINDDDSLSSFDAKDLIEFECDEPLIDLSEEADESAVQKEVSRDTVSSMNARNSNTLLSLLDLLEIGSVMRATETARVGSCAEVEVSFETSSVSKTSSSSSLHVLPVYARGACAKSSGKTDEEELSTVFPPSSIEPKNPSIVKNCSRPREASKSEFKETLRPRESGESEVQSVRAGIENIIDSTLRVSHRQCQSEKSKEENFASTSVGFACSVVGSLPKLNSFKKPAIVLAESEKSNESAHKEEEIFSFCHYSHRQQLQPSDVKSKVSVGSKREKTNDQSDTNNNRESVCNQNSVVEASPLSSVQHRHEGCTNDDESNESLKFLSPHTSQRKLPPKFYSSTNSLHHDSFEASSRLKRLEERFKGFSYTKKLLRSSKVFSKSEEILSTYGRTKEAKSSDSLNSSSSSASHFHLSSSTLSENCLRQLTEDDEAEDRRDSIGCERKASSTDEISASVLECATSDSKTTLNTQPPTVQSPESEEICKIFRDHDKDTSESAVKCKPQEGEEEEVDGEEEENCSFVYFEEVPVEDDVTGKHSVFDDLLFSNCEFDVQSFNQYLDEYGDECEAHKHCPDHNCNSDDEKSDESDFFCDCLVEAVPLYHSNIMRETGGKLRGLLKPANRPPPVKKNRVVFDETRNEFFEADYIILIREDCPYDEEDEEPCTCGDHELVRICCDEGCNCGYTDDGRTPPSPKFAPPIEFVDQATLSPPEGYKDGGLLDSALSGALGNHVFGAQHIQQLQVIQRLQQQRAAMLAARAAAANATSQQPTTTTTTPAVDPAAVCTECAECAECAAAKLAELEGECDSQCSEDPSPMEVVPPHVLAIGSLVPVQKSSPERRNQKEIVAGEERPKFLTIKQTEDAQAEEANSNLKPENQASYVVETITMTTVTEHRIITIAEDANADQPPPKPPKAVTLQPPALPEGRSIYASSQSVENMKNDLNATVIPKFNVNGTAQAITGILKGGKLRKTDSVQNDETNITSDEETSSKRSVRFNEDASGEGESTTEPTATDDEGKPKSENQLTDYVTHMSLKRHSSLFHNALRPNSAVRQLFPAKSPTSTLTHEALKAFDESKRGGNLLTASQTITSGGSASSTSTSPTPITSGYHSASDTDTIKRTIERNALRRSLIKYEPKKKITAKDSTSLEERIRQLTCDIDEPGDSDVSMTNDMERRDSPAGEENPQQAKYDKSFSPSSSASSSSCGSTGSTYKKITDLFNKDKRQEKILETDENPIVIIPQDCRCPAGPDIGMGVQIRGAHTQIHQPPPPPRQPDTKLSKLSTTLAPLTACVAGQRDDFSYYMLAKPGDRTSTASSQTTDQYSIGDIDAALQDADSKKVAPDVIAGTPGQESDELASFAQQEANRLERIKKRYSSESAPASGVNSDDDEQNDYGFNKRPSVRGIKPRFGSTNEILQQMQDQLSQPTPTVPTNLQQPQTGNQMQSNTLPRTNASGALQIAPAKVQPQQQSHHQHTASWSYYPEQVKKAGDSYGNYYHLPAHARHSYHGHEAIYQNCHTMTVQQTQAIIPGHVHQKLAQQASQPQIQAIHHAQQINRLSQYARSPTRRPESPPPLRNYHQTMVLIPYKPDGTATYPAYGIAGETSENQIYQRQHNIVEYQQVTQQTIRVPIGYPMPGMQLHVVSSQNQRTPPAPHYATLPRQNCGQGPQKFAYPVDKSSMERGVPEGEAASVQPMSDNMPPATCQDGESNNNSAVPGTVYYAMNV